MKKTVDYIKQSKVLMSLVMLIIGIALGWFLLPTKTITVEKEKIVEKVIIKNIKAKHIEQKPDGTIIADGDVSLDSVEDSKETDKEKSKTEINKKSYGISIGVITPVDSLPSLNYFIIPEADIFGRLYLAMPIMLGQNQFVGIGLGLRF